MNSEKFLEMRVVPSGRYRPTFLQYKKDESTGVLNPIVPNEDLILKVCPGINVQLVNSKETSTTKSRSEIVNVEEGVSYLSDGKQAMTCHPSVKGYAESTNSFMGPILSVRKCYASDAEVRFRAAAAGGLTAISQYLLETDQVDFVHHIKADLPNNPMMSIVQKSRDKNDLLEGSQSRYGPAAPLENILQILKERKKFCFIGKPCDVNGLSNLAKYVPDVDKFCKFKLTISCGMIPDQSMYLDWLKEQRMKKENLLEFRYRGCGCPGASPYAKTEVSNEVSSDVDRIQGSMKKKIIKEASCDYRDFFYGRQWSCQLRCKVCPDFLGEQSDITVMDCWHKGMPKGEGPGFVLILGRTEKGETLLQNCLKEKQYLTEVSVSNQNTWDDLEQDNFIINIDDPLQNKNKENCVSYTDIIRTQPHQMTRKIANHSRQLALKEANVIFRCESRKQQGHTSTEEDCKGFVPKAIVDDPSLSILLEQAIKNFHIVENMKPGSLCFKDTGTSESRSGSEEMEKTFQKYVSFVETSSNLSMQEVKIQDFLREYMHKNYEGAKDRIQKGKEK